MDYTLSQRYVWIWLRLIRVEVCGAVDKTSYSTAVGGR